MDQGLGIVLPLIFFFLIDFTLFTNSLRQKSYVVTTQYFSKLAGFVMISQGLTALSYACDYHIVLMNVSWQFAINLISLICMTIASYYWFRYLMASGEKKLFILSKREKVLLVLPVLIIICMGIPSQRFHLLFYIDANGVYQRGIFYFLQFSGCVYYLVAIYLTLRQMTKKENYINILARFLLFLVPSIIGIFINICVLRGGYTQIGCSYAVFLLYLEQYITEVNENKRLKSVENLNKNLQIINSDLLDQMSIVGGLSNAYFSVYSVDLQSGRCDAIKVIDFFKIVVKNCHSTAIVTKAFLALCVMPDDFKKMKDFTDWHTLADRLKNTDSIVEEFHGTISPWEWCRASWIVASRDDDGKACNVLFTVEDVTETVTQRIYYEKQQEQNKKELELSKAAAQSANKAKTDFLFNMSHDIRTPMNAIIGYADLMEKHLDDIPKSQDYLNKIKKSSDFLLSLVNNVLEMARIESGKIVLDESVCKVTDFMEQILSVYSELMKQKNICFSSCIDVINEYYYGDVVKLSEIFLNIVSNAYKYTNEGGSVSIQVKELPIQKEGYMLLQTTIKDSGIGMSKEFLPYIFEEFSREYSVSENCIEGTGLGMPIVKRLVDFMGGTIEVESELDKGTTFIVSIPHQIAQPQEVVDESIAVIDSKKFIGKRILLVEDNELNAEIATELLSDFGFVVEHAQDGIICINMLLDKPSFYYNLILMDVQMPHLDGYATTKRIRQFDDKDKANIPIIAMTANAFDEDRKNAYNAGMNGHLAKPIEMKKFIQTLTQIFE